VQSIAASFLGSGYSVQARLMLPLAIALEEWERACPAKGRYSQPNGCCLND